MELEVEPSTYGYISVGSSTQKRVCYMRINPINHTNQTQPAFQKVNQKYLKWAEKLYKERRNITTEWYESLRDDVNLFKDISAQDGVDTMKAVKKYVNQGSMKFYNHVLECVKRG